MDLAHHIVEIFAPIIKEYDLMVSKENDQVIILSNNNCSVIVHIDRYDHGLSFFLKDVSTGIQIPFWQVYELKGKPKIELPDADSDDKHLRTILWHRQFIEGYLKSELMTGFANILKS